MLGISFGENSLNGLNSNCSGDLASFVAPHAITYHKDLPQGAVKNYIPVFIDLPVKTNVGFCRPVGSLHLVSRLE
jgi:hypothetical protein